MHKKYLYKILSSRLWQASQNRKTVALPAEDDVIIHFASEEQLDGIIAKDWADAEQFAVLTIDPEKLEGQLVYENGSGMCLHNGFVPFSSIVESKIVYRNSDVCANCNLDIVKVGDPVLREPARVLSIDEILSPEIQNLIQEMKATMRAAPGVGLAAPQIGKPLQLIVVEDMDHSHLTAEQLAERDRTMVPFHVIINPHIFLDLSETVEFFEGCLSVPQFVGIVPRAKSVRVECLNEKAEPIVIHAKGWYARILQHEIDHLNATLYVDRVLTPTLMTEENYVRFWKGKKIQEIMDQLVLKAKNHQPIYK